MYGIVESFTIYGMQYSLNKSLFTHLLLTDLIYCVFVDSRTCNLRICRFPSPLKKLTVSYSNLSSTSTYFYVFKNSLNLQFLEVDRIKFFIENLTDIIFAFDL
uniref:Uncharacterized protein n=1 Tax=Lepeophtheirus salmonis TaxID=72036 RepID=A0A0K2VB64_LEPSM